MAVQNVTEMQSPARIQGSLTVDQIDRMDTLADRITGIADLIASAVLADETPAPYSVAMSCGAISEMTTEMKAIANGMEADYGN